MNIEINSNINLFNEALSLGIQSFKNSLESDFDLINYNKFNISKSELSNLNKNIINYFNNIKEESISLAREYQDLKNIFIKGNDSPSIASVFIYSNLDFSIKSYSKSSFIEHIKEALISNIKYRIENLSALDIDDLFDLIENSFLFDDSQKYNLFKLLNNKQNFLDRFFKYIIDLEDIIIKNFPIIKKEFNGCLNMIDDMNIFELKSLKTFKNQEIFNKIEKINIALFIHSENDSRIHIFEDNNNIFANIYIGFLYLLLKDYILELTNKKDDIQRKLSLISDANRFEIITLLAKQNLFGKEISDKLRISKSGASYHLNSLVEEDIVKIKVEGTRIYYSLNNEKIIEIIRYLKTLVDINKNKGDIKAK